jgi:hypothetical protein
VATKTVQTTHEEKKMTSQTQPAQETQTLYSLLRSIRKREGAEIKNNDVWEGVMELIKNNDTRLTEDEKDDLSQLLCDYHEALGYLVLNASYDGLLNEAIREGLVDLSELPEFSPEDFAEDFCADCGFSKHYEPSRIFWGGNGDVVWFTTFEREKLKDWLAEKIENGANNYESSRAHEHTCAHCGYVSYSKVVGRCCSRCYEKGRDFSE